MGAATDPAAVAAFRASIADTLGLLVDDARLGDLAELLGRRAAGRGSSVRAYLDGLASAGAAHPEWRDLVPELTVGETYFFRHWEQLRAFVEVALPARRGERTLRVLSAGCASGEEPYTLAMLLRGEGIDPSSVAVRAFDLNPASLQRAARGRYSRWSLRETPDELRRRWFAEEGKELVLDASIRAMVAFEERNLAHDDPAAWAPGSYDVVFCRNVLMYFAPEQARAVVARIASALAPGGYFFLGHAETLRGVSDDFVLHNTHGTFFYQRKGGAPASRRSDVSAPSPVVGALPPLDLDAWWVDAIRGSSDRIRDLADPAPSAEVIARPAPPVDLGPALALLERERFAEALDALRDLPDDDEVVLVRAALLVHGGRSAEAQSLAETLVARDARHAGARYILALCREGAGDPAGAAAHDRAAARLDPTFAMPRLHLGLMARRAGERRDAARELGEALRLLLVENPRRLLLFGGGFGRDGLVALCRTEIARLGGSP